MQKRRCKKSPLVRKSYSIINLKTIFKAVFDFTTVIFNYHNFPYIYKAHVQTIELGGKQMKNSLIIGTMLGIVTATALYCSMSNNSLKKAKRAFVNKIEDIVM